MVNKTILVVDDEKDIVELIAYNLEREGFKISRAYDGNQALQYVNEKSPVLVILDLMLPGINGLDICRLMRRKPGLENIPIIMLTAKSESVDKIIGLETGADDYITKPFNVRELVARVRAVLRRCEQRSEHGDHDIISFRELRIDLSTYEVTVGGQKVGIGPMELKLLRFFLLHPGRTYTRDQLLEYVWETDTFVEPRTVDVHISRLRAAIEKDKDDPQYIITVRGFGYKLADDT